MPAERDLFANFERMRREIDELFGDVFERGPRGGRRQFSPNVDVYYCGQPPRAIVKAELGADVVADEATATYDDGILRVEIPIAAPADEKRQVPIAREQNGDA